MNRDEIFDQIDKLFDKLKYEDFYVLDRSSRKHFMRDEILSYLLWKEVVFFGVRGEIYVNHSDFDQILITGEEIPNLLEAYLKDEVWEWGKQKLQFLK